MDWAWEITGIKTNNAIDGINTITPSASQYFNFSNPSTWH